MVYKFTPVEGETGFFYGNKILDVKVDDGDRLKVFKLSKSMGSQMKSDEIKSKAASFVYYTQTIKSLSMKYKLFLRRQIAR